MDSGGKEAAHIDDTSRIDVGFTIFPTFVSGCSKEGQAFLGESEHSLKVQRQDFGPSLILSVIAGKFQSLSRRLKHGTYVRGNRRA